MIWALPAHLLYLNIKIYFNKLKIWRDVAQVIEYLPSKLKAGARP
jgi:hypothetical protein